MTFDQPPIRSLAIPSNRFDSIFLITFSDQRRYLIENGSFVRLVEWNNQRTVSPRFVANLDTIQIELHRRFTCELTDIVVTGILNNSCLLVPAPLAPPAAVFTLSSFLLSSQGFCLTRLPSPTCPPPVLRLALDHHRRFLLDSFPHAILGSPISKCDGNPICTL